jgi:hypothetical protein
MSAKGLLFIFRSEFHPRTHCLYSGEVLLSLESSPACARTVWRLDLRLGQPDQVFLAALSVDARSAGGLRSVPSPALFSGIVFLAGLLAVPIPSIAAPVDSIARAMSDHS